MRATVGRFPNAGAVADDALPDRTPSGPLHRDPGAAGPQTRRTIPGRDGSEATPTKFRDASAKKRTGMLVARNEQAPAETGADLHKRWWAILGLNQ